VGGGGEPQPPAEHADLRPVLAHLPREHAPARGRGRGGRGCCPQRRWRRRRRRRRWWWQRAESASGVRGPARGRVSPRRSRQRHGCGRRGPGGGAAVVMGPCCPPGTHIPPCPTLYLCCCCCAGHAARPRDVTSVVPPLHLSFARPTPRAPSSRARKPPSLPCRYYSTAYTTTKDGGSTVCSSSHPRPPRLPRGPCHLLQALPGNSRPAAVSPSAAAAAAAAPTSPRMQVNP